MEKDWPFARRNYPLPIEKMTKEEWDQHIETIVIDDLIKKTEAQLNGDCLFSDKKINTRVFLGAKIGIMKEYVAALRNMDTIDAIIYHKMLVLLEAIEKESNNGKSLCDMSLERID